MGIIKITKKTMAILALSGFAKFDKESNIACKNEPSHIKDDSAIVTLRFSDIDYIEIFN